MSTQTPSKPAASIRRAIEVILKQVLVLDVSFSRAGNRVTLPILRPA